MATRTIHIKSAKIQDHVNTITIEYHINNSNMKQASQGKYLTYLSICLTRPTQVNVISKEKPHEG